MRRFCTYCGGELPSPGARFCIHCGAPVPPITPPPYAPRQRSRTGEFFLTLLKCLGYYAVYFGIMLLFEVAHELYIAYFSGVSVTSLEDLYRALSGHYCEIGIISAVITLLTFFVIFKARKKSPLGELYIKTFKPKYLLPLILLGVLGQAAVTGALTLLYALFPSLSDTQTAYYSDLLLSGGNIYVQFIFIAVVTPLLEETVFRALIYSRLKKVMPTGVAIVMSAVIFGAAHGNAEQFCYAGLLGLVFAAAFEMFDSVFASTAIHFAFNASSYLVFLMNGFSFVDFLALFFISAGFFALTTALIFFTKTKAGHIDEAL